MNNHVYKFNNVLRVHENEGGIGVELTGIQAELYMVLWDFKLNKKLVSLKLQNNFNDRFVDDKTLIPTELPQGIDSLCK